MQQSTEFSQFFWEDSEGLLWIFGFEGLVKAIPNSTGYQFEYFVNNPQDRSTLSSNIVLSVADDPLEPRRYLWVGTKSGGLNRLDKQSGTFKQYKREQGLPDNVIYGVLAENPSKTGGSARTYLAVVRTWVSVASTYGQRQQKLYGCRWLAGQ
ncbi:MAG: hypothetical protein IPL27_22690 [Lewinellaceae bacterium]|nr:hypothetical protein [Lewinellaceae bacterium]